MTTAVKRETFEEWLFRGLAQGLSVLAIATLIITIGIMIISDRQNEKLEREYGTTITDDIFVNIESIPVEEKVADTMILPIDEPIALEPEQVTFMSIYEEEILIARAKAEEEARWLAEAIARNPQLGMRVEGIKPTVRMMNTSAYCPCVECCGKDDGLTATEVKATEWYTVAAGTVYPFGTIIYIPSLQDKPNGGWFIVEDRGGAISSDKLDIYFNSHFNALQYGRRDQECYIFEF